MLPEWRSPRPRCEPSRKLARPRIGPTMRELHAIISACPGISKAAALRAADLPDRGMGAYRPVNRALAAGLLVVQSRPGAVVPTGCSRPTQTASFGTCGAS